MAVALTRHWRISSIAPPVVLCWLALEDGHEEVKDVVYADDNEEEQDGDALPGIVDAEPEQKDADDKLDKRRDDNVDDLACPLAN